MPGPHSTAQDPLRSKCVAIPTEKYSAKRERMQNYKIISKASQSPAGDVAVSVPLDIVAIFMKFIHAILIFCFWVLQFGPTAVEQAGVETSMDFDRIVMHFYCGLGVLYICH